MVPYPGAHDGAAARRCSGHSLRGRAPARAGSAHRRQLALGYCRRVDRYEIDRRAYGIGYREQAAFKDTYGGAEGTVFLECHHLVPTRLTSDTVLVFSHPIGGGAYLPMVTELARCGTRPTRMSASSSSACTTLPTPTSRRTRPSS